MYRYSLIITIVLSLVYVGFCGNLQSDANSPLSKVPHVVTSDIQAGIEEHIEKKTRQGGGYYKIKHGNETLDLKLVRIHTEYLANLGPKRHFACVDFASKDGDVYDVDFFMEGDPGEMKVTETTIHKTNGKPMYVWKQKPDKTWFRFPVDKASSDLLGVIENTDKFNFHYYAKLPKISEDSRIWIPMPSSDEYQTVKLVSIKTPRDFQTVKDEEYGNKILFTELLPEDSGKTIELVYSVERKEKSPYSPDDPNLGRYLKAEKFVPLEERFAKIAQEVVQGKEGELVRARAIYDHVIERMRYAKYGEGWGKGNAVFACNSRRGNCTDFHSYFIALARSAGIPARFAIGAAIPSERDEGGVNGYHCWAEFYAEDKWWPVDVSEADKCTSLYTYYFGHHPANRIEFTKGRDLKVQPQPASGPINFLAYPLLEVDGEPVKTEVVFSFERKS